jgi:hypothetical protein
MTNNNLVFSSASVAAGSYMVNLQVAATNAANSPQTYPLTVTINASTGMANFTISGGNIIKPGGGVYTAKGIACYDSDMGQVQQLLFNLFPGTQIIRLACYSYQSPQTYANFISFCSSHNIVVVIEDHTTSTGSNGGGAQGVNYTGQALMNMTNWYAANASFYLGNPLVWFGTRNEPPNTLDAATLIEQGSLTTEHVATYNAIRGTGSKTIIEVELFGGGVPFALGANNTQGLWPDSAYATMFNIVWGPHYYNWVSNYATDVASNANAYRSMIAQCQQVTTADGTAPCGCFEYGPSTTGSGVDPGGIASVQAVQSQLGISGGVSITLAWTWDGGGDDEITDGGGDITNPYGTTVAAYLAS